MQPRNVRSVLVTAALAMFGAMMVAPAGEPGEPKGLKSGGAIGQEIAVSKERIDFSWRTTTGALPADKPGYLILTTEDTLHYSRVLPRFVEAKNKMGFHTYVATEKDFGSGKSGKEQVEQVNAWLKSFQERTSLKYALLIGDARPFSGDLPVGINPNVAGQKDPVLLSRIWCVGNEGGNSIYDLDRILDRAIHYTQETAAGKSLDWRARGHSVISNYGIANWDTPLIRTLEQAGGTMVWRSTRGTADGYAVENGFDGQSLRHELLFPSERMGFISTMSHGWGRGCEGIIKQHEILQNFDDRWPAVVSIACCNSMAYAQTCNIGQSWLRRGAIFVSGTSWSGNNATRITSHVVQINNRVSVGEAIHNRMDQVGDPSLHVLPLAGVPVTQLQVQPAIRGVVALRDLAAEGPFEPIAQEYKLTNRSAVTMKIDAECDAGWISLSTANLVLKPGETAAITATSTDRLPKMAPGRHAANIRFTRDDGQRDLRRIGVVLNAPKDDEPKSEEPKAKAPKGKASAAKAPKVAPAPDAKYLDDGVFRVAGVPAVFDLTNADTRLDLSKIIKDGDLDASLRDAPTWLELKNGVLGLKAGTDFDWIDYGGYGIHLVLKARNGPNAGRSCEIPINVRIPLPAVGIRIVRAADNTLSIVNAAGAGKPLANGVIRCTFDGSPVTETSPIYEKPFKPENKKVAARFFYLGVYPMAPVTLDCEVAIARDKWKVVSSSGKPGSDPAAAFDGNPETAWRNDGGALPQHIAWDLGEEKTLTSVLVHSHVQDATGRIKGYTLHGSADGKSWAPLASGALPNSPDPHRVAFKTPQTARYLKLEVTSLYAGKDAVVTEVEAYER